MKRGWFKHAFAIDKPGEAEPTPEQQVPVDWIAKQVTKRHLTTPSLIALEVCRPLNWLAAQGLHFAEPAVFAMSSGRFHEHYKNFAEFAEHRGSIDYIARRIEHYEAQHVAREKQSRDAAASSSHKADTKDGDEQDRS